MPIALAGLASLLWGTADFLGGLAASGWRAERVAAISQVVGLGILLVLAPVLTGALAPGEDLAWGAAAGIAGAVGATLLYRSLAIGPMNVAAPTIAVVAAMVPAAVGLVRGERPGALALAGVALAIVSVAMVGGASAPGPTEPRPSIRVLGLSAASGATLGLANVAFAQTSRESGLWPVTTTKLVAGIILWSVVLATRTSDGPRAPRRNARLALWTGLVDVAATTSLALALQRGSLVLVSVVGSLFPAVTVVLARFVLEERIARVQAVGLALALAAVAMIVAG
ncbi:MAG: EamA family transporter [Actinomycetota bacterium]